MDSLLQIAIGILLASFAVRAGRRALRQKAIRERTDALCGLATRAKTGPPETVGADARAMMAIEVLGLASANFTTRIYLAFSPIALALATAFSGWTVGLGLFAALIAGYFAIVRWQKRKRTQQFTDALPGLLERVRRLVMIGNTLQHAFIESVASADPLTKREIEPFVRRMQYGAPFTEAVEMLARHNDVVELHMLAAYVKTNAKFGGRVAQTLANLIDQLTNKRRLEREIRAATAETRASAAILFGLMAFLVVVMSVMNPQYFAFYAGSEQGHLIFLCILIWPLMGVLLMKRILTLEF